MASELGVDEIVGPDLGLRWNVSPTDQLYAVAGRREPGGVKRRLGTMAWGLVPSWANDVASGPRPINARVESLGGRPLFAGALATRRCLVPVDGFYEWGTGADGTRRPHFLAPPDGSVLAIAAVWDRWCGADDETVVSCAVITTEANDDVAPLHDRMPACLELSDWEEWLDPANHDEEALRQLLRPSPLGRLVTRPVSRLVNNTANDGPQLLADAEPEPPSLFPT
ncbi:MAG: SOS response-associated peptidase [Actinomycetota bacterium]|nr:SOS response-associated peptidase [Actinomycetota bacterium]